MVLGISHASPFDFDSLYPWDEDLSDEERVLRLADDLDALGLDAYRPCRRVSPTSRWRRSAGGPSER